MTKEVKKETIEEVKAKLVKAEKLAEKETSRADKAEQDAVLVKQDVEEVREGVIYLEVRVKGADEDGGKKIFSYKSSGATPEEVLKNLDFPKGLVALTRIIVKRDGKENEVALSPTRAQRLLCGKDPRDLENTLKDLRDVQV